MVLRGPESQPSAATPDTQATAPVAPEPEDSFGLLEPRTLTDLPDENDMRPTVDTDASPPVIATPPTTEP